MGTGYRSWVVVLLGLGLFFGGCQGGGEAAKEGAAEVAGEGSGQGLAAVHEGPYLTVDRSVHDFGQAGPGARVSCTFTLTNRGTEPVTIRKVKTDCGCTVAKLKRYTLAAGESEPLEVQLHVPSQAGLKTKVITVLVSPPGKPLRVPMSLKVEVRPIIAVVPSPLTLELRGEKTVSGTVVLSSSGGEAFSVTGCRGQGDLHVSFGSEAQSSHELALEGESLQLRDKSRKMLIIETDHPQAKTVPVQVKVVPPFSSRPAVRTFFNVKPGESRTSSVTVFSNFGESFEVGPKIGSKNGYATVSKVTKVTETKYRLDMVLEVPAETEGTALRDMLTIPIVGYPAYSVKVHCHVRVGQKR